jgi:phage terminase large subunit
MDSWSGIDVGQTTMKALQYCQEYKATVLNYDSIGVGAGVKSTINMVGTKNILCNAVSVAESPTEGKYGEKTNKDTFLNLRAQFWWLMRDKFKEKAISIPNDSTLISELSQPLYFFNENGKIKIESKKDMRSRGIKSPNIADALMLSFYIDTSIVDYNTLTAF